MGIFLNPFPLISLQTSVLRVATSTKGPTEFTSGSPPSNCRSLNIGVNGQSYLTIIYHIAPLALGFVFFEVQRSYLLNSPDGWREGETVLGSSRVSPTNPDLLEIVERSLFPIGTEWSEFLRIRHETIGGKATNPYDPPVLLEQTQGDSERFRFYGIATSAAVAT